MGLIGVEKSVELDVNLLVLGLVFGLVLEHRIYYICIYIYDLYAQMTNYTQAVIIFHPPSYKYIYI